MHSPAVSIIVPCYNGGEFLADLLDSLRAQTFRDFEIIIVDDGSSDAGTRTILEQIESSVKVVRQENRGLPAARNTGFRCARADLVLPLDCDDTLEPSFLQEAVKALTAASPNIGFVFAHMRTNGALESVLPRHFNSFDQLFLNQLPYCMLIRKSAWLEVGGYDEAMRAGYEDWEFNIRLARNGLGGIELAKPLFNYRVSPSGMLLSRSARMHGALWRSIRTKHADLYGARALFGLWRKARPIKVSLGLAMMLLVLAKTLPDAVFGRLFHLLLTTAHARRAKRGVAPAQPPEAVISQDRS